MASGLWNVPFVCPLASAARGEPIVIVAEEVDSGTIVGTVQVVLAMLGNRPHRADIVKMQIRRSLSEVVISVGSAPVPTFFLNNAA
jgi:hypothetical protein